MFVLVCPIGGNKDKRTLPDTKIVLSTGKDYPLHLFRTLIGRALLLFREKTGKGIVQRRFDGLFLRLRTAVAVFLHKAERVQNMSPAPHLAAYT